MLKLEDIMTTDVLTVKKQTPIYEAIEIMANNKITGLPVVNDDMTLAGIISEKDVLRMVSDFDILMLSSELKDSSVKVEDFMTEDVTSFDTRDDLMAVCECLVKNNFRRVPILAEGKLAGIISRKDIINYILTPVG